MSPPSCYPCHQRYRTTTPPARAPDLASTSASAFFFALASVSARPAALINAAVAAGTARGGTDDASRNLRGGSRSSCGKGRGKQAGDAKKIGGEQKTAAFARTRAFRVPPLLPARAKSLEYQNKAQRNDRGATLLLKLTMAATIRGGKYTSDGRCYPAARAARKGENQITAQFFTRSTPTPGDGGKRRWCKERGARDTTV